jgi:pimeloyl-ACP methyl ester carboxylesterase
MSTIVTVPCFSGAPWDARQLQPFAGRNVVTMRLPEGLDTVEAHADFLADQVRDRGDYVLVGDSYGAVIALTLATRRPSGLSGLVLSGGFAANPLPAWKGVAASASRFAGGPLYRQGTLRFHAYQLHSHFDATAPVPHTQDDYRRLFIDNTPRASYTARVTSVTHFDIRQQLGRVDVPTLLLTPEDDKLVGTQAAQEMLAGIPDVTEVVLPRTGHMFRFTHPDQYGQAITAFIDQRVRTQPAKM